MTHSEQESDVTIVTASTGNHGLACLDATQCYHIRGKIVVPETISQVEKHGKKTLNMILLGVVIMGKGDF